MEKDFAHGDQMTARTAIHKSDKTATKEKDIT